MLNGQMKAQSMGASIGAQANPSPMPVWQTPYSLTGFLYRFMLGNMQEKAYALRAVTDDILEEAVECSQSRNLKFELLKEIRERTFRNIHHNSIIINEVTGIYNFAKRAAKYVRATARMYLDA